MRWRAFEEAIDSGVDEELFRRVAAEPDVLLTAAVVTRVLERAPDDQHRRRVELLPPQRRTHCARRAVETALLRRADPLSAADVEAALEGWSD